MKPEYKQRWIDALISGDYAQGKKCLKEENTYCCLGVLCDLVKDEVEASWESDDKFRCGLLHYDSILPSKVMELVGLEDNNPVIEKLEYVPDDYKNNGVKKITLAELNDGGKDFKYIAEVIKECL